MNALIDQIELGAKDLFNSAILERRKLSNVELCNFFYIPDIEESQKSTAFMDVF